MVGPGNPCWRERLSTFDLLVLVLDELILILNNIFINIFSKTNLNTKVSEDADIIQTSKSESTIDNVVVVTDGKPSKLIEMKEQLKSHF